jgi:hypothetical protein
MASVELLGELLERRVFDCRLDPDRPLGTLAEAEAFLQDRGLLTRTADCALPSLYEACHEEPYKPGSPGFATWPATKWPWFGELAEWGYLIAAVHRGKNLLVTGEVAGLLDPFAGPRSPGCGRPIPAGGGCLIILPRPGPPASMTSGWSCGSSGKS